MPQPNNVEKAIRLLQEIQVLKWPGHLRPPGENLTDFRDRNKSQRQIWNLNPHTPVAQKVPDEAVFDVSKVKESSFF